MTTSMSEFALSEVLVSSSEVVESISELLVSTLELPVVVFASRKH